MPNPSTYFYGSFAQKPAPASLPSSAMPTFAGITSITANSDGSLTANYSAGTTANPPIEYLVYIALGSVSAAVLFVSTNLQRIVPSGILSARVVMLANGTYLTYNGIYTMGVRAKDAYGNMETNTAIQTATVTGVNYSSLYSAVDALPTLTEIEASTVLAKEKTSKTILGNVV